jgi:AcrR family transcriptional regulator
MRTREAVQDALIALARRKDYRDIRVDELCEQAGVGRSTFYQHFANKDDVKSRGAMRLRAQLRAIQEQSGGVPLSYLPALLAHAREFAPHYKVLGAEARAVSLRAVRDMLEDLIRHDYDHLQLDVADRELSVQFRAGALMSALSWWLDRDAKPAPEQVARSIRRMMGLPSGEI